ncbi:6815_t:CDS:2 [Ambispora leptoticha]|uniref:6815_t:CDS:1 n=1 Tax=Ambispora leptoticha TaxID=144679 RepID=A0A9N8Z4B5_9GLOM|nr:6815_t:CDS:2 [Ambispora leptoticha]
MSLPKEPTSISYVLDRFSRWPSPYRNEDSNNTTAINADNSNSINDQSGTPWRHYHQPNIILKLENMYPPNMTGGGGEPILTVYDDKGSIVEQFNASYKYASTTKARMGLKSPVIGIKYCETEIDGIGRTTEKFIKLQIRFQNIEDFESCSSILGRYITKRDSLITTTSTVGSISATAGAGAQFNWNQSEHPTPRIFAAATDAFYNQAPSRAQPIRAPLICVPSYELSKHTNRNINNQLNNSQESNVSGNHHQNIQLSLAKQQETSSNQSNTLSQQYQDRDSNVLQPSSSLTYSSPSHQQHSLNSNHGKEQTYPININRQDTFDSSSLHMEDRFTFNSQPQPQQNYQLSSSQTSPQHTTSDKNNFYQTQDRNTYSAVNSLNNNRMQLATEISDLFSSSSASEENNNNSNIIWPTTQSFNQQAVRSSNVVENSNDHPQQPSGSDSNTMATSTTESQKKTIDVVSLLSPSPPAAYIKKELSLVDLTIDDEVSPDDLFNNNNQQQPYQIKLNGEIPRAPTSLNRISPQSNLSSSSHHPIITQRDPIFAQKSENKTSCTTEIGQHSTSYPEKRFSSDRQKLFDQNPRAPEPQSRLKTKQPQTNAFFMDTEDEQQNLPFSSNASENMTSFPLQQHPAGQSSTAPSTSHAAATTADSTIGSLRKQIAAIQERQQRQIITNNNPIPTDDDQLEEWVVNILKDPEFRELVSRVDKLWKARFIVDDMLK